MTTVSTVCLLQPWDDWTIQAIEIQSTHRAPGVQHSAQRQQHYVHRFIRWRGHGFNWLYAAQSNNHRWPLRYFTLMAAWFTVWKMLSNVECHFSDFHDTASAHMSWMSKAACRSSVLIRGASPLSLFSRTDTSLLPNLKSYPKGRHFTYNKQESALRTLVEWAKQKTVFESHWAASWSVSKHYCCL